MRSLAGALRTEGGDEQVRASGAMSVVPVQEIIRLQDIARLLVHHTFLLELPGAEHRGQLRQGTVGENALRAVGAIEQRALNHNERSRRESTRRLEEFKQGFGP